MASPSVFVERRARLAEALRAAGGGVAVIPTAPERPRNSDNDHPFRHDSSFHYLTGFDEPGAWLVLHASGEAALGCHASDPEMEIWHGHRLGVDAAPAALGVDAAFDVATLDAVMLARLDGAPAVWSPFNAGAEVARRINGWLATLCGRARSGVEAPMALREQL